MAQLFSEFEGVVAWSGGNTLIKGGQKFDSQHPLVRERPDLFRSAENEDEADATQSATVANRQAETRVETGMQHPAGTRTATGNRVPKITGQGQ